MFLFAQTNIPNVSTWIQLIAFLAVIALQAYGIYAQNNKIRDTSISTNAKIEEVHKTVNSSLTLYKDQAAEQYKTALQQGIDNARLELQRVYNEKTSALEARIASLEVKLDTERLKAVALAASVSKTPDSTARLEEIRGQA